MSNMVLGILKIFGFLSQNKKALTRADQCLLLCQISWGLRLGLEYKSPAHTQAVWLERHYARAHNRFLRLAYRKPAFKKG